MKKRILDKYIGFLEEKGWEGGKNKGNLRMVEDNTVGKN